MKRKFAVFAIVLIFLTIFSAIAANAESVENAENSFQSIYDNVPKTAKSELDKIFQTNGLNSSLKLDGIISVFSKKFTGIFGDKLYILISIFAIAIFASMSESFIHQKNISNIVTVISGSACVILFLNIMLPDLNDAQSGVQAMSAFVKTSIPVLATLFATSGQPVSGATFTMLLDFGAGIILSIYESILMPIINVVLALNISAIFLDNQSITAIIQMLKKVVTVSLGVIVALFCSFLTLQTVLSLSTDNIATKGVKVAITSLIPYMGAAVSEAVDSVFKITRGIRSGAAVACIITVVLIFAVPILKLTINALMLIIARFITGILGANRLTAILTGLFDCVTMCLSVTLFSLLLVVVSLVLLIFTGLTG